ncbi:LrgB family protein [Lachnospiraceae bacterium 62-35]
MKEALANSMYFGFVLSIGAYEAGMWLKKKTGFPLFNPLLVAVILIIPILKIIDVTYDEYNEGAKYISYMLTPATVCLAIPLYKQLHLLKKHAMAVICAITGGVLANAVTIFAMCLAFRMSHVYYVTLLPKSITTAIGMGVSQESGGVVSLTVVSIVITGISGSIMAEALFKFLHIDNPVSRGLSLGTGAHAIGTAKALELGEIEGAMSSLSIAVAGLMTVIIVPLIAGWI